MRSPTLPRPRPAGLTMATLPALPAALLAAALVLAPAGCAPDGAAGPDTHTAFMKNLAHHCGQAFPGALTLEPPGDEMLTGTEELLVHFRDCEDDEVRIPFHIEVEGRGEGEVEGGGKADSRVESRWDRSRTWYLIRHADRLELRHDHRRPDGGESTRTWYGGFTAGPGTATRQDFVSPERTEAAGVPVGWRIEIEPGGHYAYGTTYDGEYDWRIEFDLSTPLEGAIPPAWGHDRPPTRRPGPP
jgi:hypothetical protein